MAADQTQKVEALRLNPNSFGYYLLVNGQPEFRIVLGQDNARLLLAGLLADSSVQRIYFLKEGTWYEWPMP